MQAVTDLLCRCDNKNWGRIFFFRRLVDVIDVESKSEHQIFPTRWSFLSKSNVLSQIINIWLIYMRRRPKWLEYHMFLLMSSAAAAVSTGLVFFFQEIKIFSHIFVKLYPICMKLHWTKLIPKSNAFSVMSSVAIAVHVAWSWGRLSSARNSLLRPSHKMLFVMCRGTGLRLMIEALHYYQKEHEMTEYHDFRLIKLIL